jgi:predicted  nucleic acid-binding Zn-ribbon protein
MTEKIQALLEYQTLDLRIVRAEGEVERSAEKKKALDAYKTVTELKEEMNKANKAADDLLTFYNRSQVYYKDNKSKIEELERRLTPEEAVGDTDKLNNALRSLLDTFGKMESNLSGYGKQIGDVIRRFQTLHKKAREQVKLYQEARLQYEELKKVKQPEIDAMKKELGERRARLDDELVSHYDTLRSDKVNPPLVPLYDRSCGGCRTELSIAVIESIRAKGLIECDYCHRLIYRE